MTLVNDTTLIIAQKQHKAGNKWYFLMATTAKEDA
jgi:hypothetical protein